MGLLLPGVEHCHVPSFTFARTGIIDAEEVALRTQRHSFGEAVHVTAIWVYEVVLLCRLVVEGVRELQLYMDYVRLA